MAWIGNEDTGGIVDMFIDDTIGEDKRRAKKLKLKNQRVSPGGNKRGVIIRRIERDIKTLKRMGP